MFRNKRDVKTASQVISHISRVMKRSSGYISRIFWYYLLAKTKHGCWKLDLDRDDSLLHCQLSMGSWKRYSEEDEVQTIHRCSSQTKLSLWGKTLCSTKVLFVKTAKALLIQAVTTDLEKTTAHGQKWPFNLKTHCAIGHYINSFVNWWISMDGFQAIANSEWWISY